MIDYIITGEREKRIQDFEAEMLEKHKKLAIPYLPRFDVLGYELEIVLGWANLNRKTWSYNRLPIVNGYECFVYCLVKKDGEEVHVASKDGEADYYVLEKSWMISYVHRCFHKLKISLYESVDEVDADLNDLLLQLRHMQDVD